MASEGLIGVTLSDKFRIERMLGSGGMGAVYEGTQIALQRRVAIKLLHAHHGDESDRRRFLREAKVVGTLRHPNIVGLIDFGEDPARRLLYLVMDHVRGVSLVDVVEAGRLRWPIALALVGQIAEGLASAHDRGVLHRDLKPENVMVSREANGTAHVRLLDFGLATAVDDSTRLTKTGSLFGTPAFMAPEQALGQTLGPAADLYAVGVILFELLTGRLPIDAPAMVLMARKVDEDAPRLDHFLPQGEVPAEVVDLVAALLERDPNARLDRASELGDRIARILGSDDFAPPIGGSEALDFSEWYADRREPHPVRHPTLLSAVRTSPADDYEDGSTDPLPQLQQASTLVEERATHVEGLRHDRGTSAAAPQGLTVRDLGMAAVAALAVGGIAFAILSATDDAPPPAPAPSVPKTVQAAVTTPRPPTDLEPRPPQVEADVGGPAAIDAGVAANRDAGSGMAPTRTAGCDREAVFTHMRELTTNSRHGPMRWTVVLPEDYDPGRAYRTLFVFHTEGESQLAAIEQRGMVRLEDWVVIAPADNSANALRPWFEGDFSDRTELVRTSFHETGRIVCLDPRWIFGVGHGSGGRAVERVIMDLPLSGIAGSGFRYRAKDSPEIPPFSTPFIHLWGVDDPYLPRDGLTPCNHRRIQSLSAKTQRWKGLNSCSGEPQTFVEREDGTCFRWECEAPFALCEVQGGNQWPAGDSAIEAQVKQLRDQLGWADDCVQKDRGTTFPYARVILKFFDEYGEALNAEETDRWRPGTPL